MKIQPTPPHLFLKFFRWYCHPKLADHIEGDLLEDYGVRIKKSGKRKADIRFIIDVLLLFRPGIIRPTEGYQNLNNYSMFKSYFKIGWRNLKRNRGFAIINVVGLSLSIACAILIFKLVVYHLSFDNFHANTNRIHRIVSEFHYEVPEYTPGVPQPLGKAFLNDFSFAEKVARIRSFRTVKISLPDEKEDKKFQEENLVAFSEPTFFQIFNFPLVYGDQSHLLTEPNTAIITQSIAKKYFGTEEALNKIIRINSFDVDVDFKITGILEDIPDNSHRKEQVYLHYTNLKDFNAKMASDDNWGSVSGSMQCFVLLKPDITRVLVDKAFPAFIKKYYDDEDEKVTVFKLQPLSDIHFNPIFGGSINKTYLFAMTLIGFFLVVTACVNFINLATAQALNRSKEVGVRKVLGSKRSNLFFQFMTETFLITSIALILGYGMAKLVLPFINALFKIQLSLTLLQQWQVPAFILTVLLFVVILAGSYPGFLLSRFHPVNALKRELSQKDVGGFSLRKVLIVTQFAISQMIIIDVLVIEGQMHYSKTLDLGFTQEATVMLPIPVSDMTKMNTLRARLEEVSGVERSSLCFEAPASSANSFTSVRFDNHVKDEPFEINLKDADDRYVSTFGLKLIGGRDLLPADSTREFLVNETFTKKLGYTSPYDVIGKKLSVNGGKLMGPIVGVVQDFYNNSLHEAISPICLMINYNRFKYCAVKMQVQYTPAALRELEKIWTAVYPDQVFAYNFVDERIAGFYTQDTVMLSLVKAFATIAIIIACLGLYGLVSFMTSKRTKEIGIRKVLGAGVHDILWLFGKEFMLLLSIAFVIAAPISWTTMNTWLQSFVYRIQVNPSSFLWAIACTLAAAAITVAYHALKSALSNPVKSLRSE